jgi:hypothetical protein
MYVFEGTPEEISQVAQTMLPMSASNTMSVEPPKEMPPATTPSKTSEGPAKFVTVEFARRVLTRLPLSGPFKAVLKALNEAHPEWVSSADLYKASGYTVPQFSGLMGAFGRRMLHTDGFDEDAHFFDYAWDEKVKAWKYRLPDTVREALRLESLG